jgi:hypothetical protein
MNFYGELKSVVMIEVPFSEALQIRARTIIFAIIQPANIDETHSGIPYYTKMGRIEAVDLNTVQCLVGRVYDRKKWAIIDRSELKICDMT